MDNDAQRNLIKRLGMSIELEPLVDEEFPRRFEQAIETALGDSATRNLKAYANVHATAGAFDLARNVRTAPHIAVTYRSCKPEKYGEAVSLFRQQYGIGAERQPLAALAQAAGVSKTRVTQKIEFVAQVLSQHYKRAIWYDCL